MRYAASLSESIFLACFAAFALACSSETSGASAQDHAGSQGSAATSGGQGGGPVFTSSGNGSGAGTGTGSGGGCAAQSTKAESLPLDIYILEDKSGSMNDNGKWNSVKAAFKTFVEDPATAGLGVGLGYFGMPGSAMACPNCNDTSCFFACGCTSVTCINGQCMCSDWGVSCNAADYTSPDVPIAQLPGVGSAILNSLAAHSPDGSTPSTPALTGAIQYAKGWAAAHAHTVVVVLATDGEPTECDPNTVQTCAAAAQAGVAEGIKTFVIGVGSSLSNLDAVAAAGGTTKAYLVDTGGNTNQQFVDALNAIRMAANLPCTYALPAPTSGQKIDPGKVNVKLTEGDPPTASTIPNVKTAADCGTTGGWYYDDPTNPTQIIMCDTTCKTLTTAVGGEVDIEVGCATEVKPPN